MKTVLLIGGYGKIGSKFREKFKKKYKIITKIKNKKFDITNFKTFDKLHQTKNIDVIINFSGQINKSKIKMHKTILIGNENLIRFVKNYKSKNIIIFYLSSSLVYGYSKNLKRENSILKPISIYAKYKVMAENLFKKSGVKYNIIRLCNVYGINNKNIISKILYSFNYKKKFNANNLNAYRNYIHVEDFLNIIQKLIDKKITGMTYNVGNQNLNILNLIKLIKKKVKGEILIKNKNKSLKKLSSQKIDINKIINDINYKPKITIENFIDKHYAT